MNISLDPEQNPTISIDEAAVVLGISRATAYVAAHNGTLPTLSFGIRRLRVPTAQLRRMLLLDEPETGT